MLKLNYWENETGGFLDAKKNSKTSNGGEFKNVFTENVIELGKEKKARIRQIQKSSISYLNI